MLEKPPSESSTRMRKRIKGEHFADAGIPYWRADALFERGTFEDT